MGKARADRLAERFDGQIPSAYQVRILKKRVSALPTCNFIILRHHARAPVREEIFFGWGFSKGHENESMFRSTDEALIRFFREYHRSLRLDEVSEPYRPAVPQRA